MQTFWILFAASAFAALLILCAIALGARFKSKLKPGTVLALGPGHGLHGGDTITLDGVEYRVAVATSHDVTLGERVA